MTAQDIPHLSIDEIARDTGLGKDTLRVWERRYGFPDPLRTSTGERTYSPDQLARLRLLCRLIDQGHRPGQIVPLPVGELELIAQQPSEVVEENQHPRLAELILSLRAGKTDTFKHTLTDLLSQQGPEAFVYETAEPLLALTGDAWAKGEIPIYLEHFVTQQLIGAIHMAMGQINKTPNGLRILLTTLPGEPHGMGIMMVELLLRLRGVTTINIGLETPLDQLQQACETLNPHAVALSFSAIQKRPQTMAMLREIDAKLPASINILAGGRGISKLRSIPDRIQVIKQMSKLNAALRPLQRHIEEHE